MGTEASVGRGVDFGVFFGKCALLPAVANSIDFRHGFFGERHWGPPTRVDPVLCGSHPQLFLGPVQVFRSTVDQPNNLEIV